MDRLIDLLISTEAIFLKRSGIRTFEKYERLTVEAAELLHDDDSLAERTGGQSFIRERVGQLVKSCYQRRNAEMHADSHPVDSPMTLLNGNETSDLATAVDDLDLLVRRAITTVVHSEAKP